MIGVVTRSNRQLRNGTAACSSARLSMLGAVSAAIGIVALQPLFQGRVSMYASPTTLFVFGCAASLIALLHLRRRMMAIPARLKRPGRVARLRSSQARA